MRTRLFNLWQALRASLWFLPGLMVLSAIILAFLLLYIDGNYSLSANFAGSLLYNAGPEGARSLLSTIAGSVITVTGVTFSITIVALTLASSQFGPRLLRNFMRDTSNQFVLGTFISTFIYCLLVLRSVEAVDGNPFVPSLSVSMAVVLMLANAGVLVFFIHHISISIQADYVITGVSSELTEHINRIFEDDNDQQDAGGFDSSRLDGYGHEFYISSSKDGYLQAIDHSGLVKIAQADDYLFFLHSRAGKYVVKGDVLVTVKSREKSEEKHGPIVRSFIIGTVRTPEQDPEYAIHQLVEVAIRALSPGINDPFTAISCIDRIGSAICFVSTKKFPSSLITDNEDKLRLVTMPVDFTGMVNAAFDQIRQNGQKNVAVTIRLLEVLGNIGRHLEQQEYKDAILRQAVMIQRVGRESFPEENDRADVQQKYGEVLKSLNGCS
ncbi:DUF2254 domain-containing protein [Desulfopila inferna]|uniref:DUF2254 domain-containing protein n=1 Tax=Desulfopila inferna TaxID=468528 RepID=UPI001966234D|nr:DUF2254 domain-containing protein [Desulfopila inferna]MBM9606643.1 DUF2254 domain-containing protein [Desulfopila inferna]